MILISTDSWPVTDWLHVTGPKTAEQLYQAVLEKLQVLPSFKLLPDDEQLRDYSDGTTLNKIFRYDYRDEVGAAILVSDSSGVSIRIPGEKTRKMLADTLQTTLN